jgi:hypothetical protein
MAVVLNILLSFCLLRLVYLNSEAIIYYNYFTFTCVIMSAKMAHTIYIVLSHQTEVIAS